MQQLFEALKKRAEAFKPIGILLAGAGQMGTDLIVQLQQMVGMSLVSITVRSDFEKCFEALRVAGYAEEHWRVVSTSAHYADARQKNKIAVSDDVDLLLASDDIEVVIDATGHPESGAMIATKTIAAGKHIVMLNVETDVTVGRYLHYLARQKGVVYTGAAGDEPAAATELVFFARTLGLQVVAAGKGKNNAFDVAATPAQFEQAAIDRNMNPRVLTEFVDGTKTMVEMVALANATGLIIDVAGMHGPNASLENLSDVFRLRTEGGVLGREGVADFTVGKGVAPGVFCVVKAPHARISERLSDLHIGKGPLYTLHRPYHLTSIETPLSAAKAVLFGQPDLVPLQIPVAEVCVMAKRDLIPGEKLGRIGEGDYRGWAMDWSEAYSQSALPLGLAERALITKPVKKGELLTIVNCIPDETLLIVQLRRHQDALLCFSRGFGH
ncbi:NAD(P)H-dependent oxidoreductase [Buttiauxella ferragutiae]|uniref:NAD(P)H-dependent oxidoreductase n=1 Tax=Buttiauxella ferragutiae TaxID=82989 RepID=UPI001E36F8E8|nr:homoserine dehydrogenase [Buttiauxella ferragutiae]MCE0828847.1 homoserine dehydrogenase [Buttiauxella ferragutiae]